MSAAMKYAPFSAFISTSCSNFAPFLKAFNCNDEIKYVGFSSPSDQTIFAFNASLGSALSTIIALKA